MVLLALISIGDFTVSQTISSFLNNFDGALLSFLVCEYVYKYERAGGRKEEGKRGLSIWCSNGVFSCLGLRL